MYYWRRRLPNALASWFYKRHLFLSLQTPDPNFARRLVVLLDAKLEEVVTAFENAEMHLTPPQVDGLLRNVVTTHLNKLERLSAAAKSCRNSMRRKQSVTTSVHRGPIVCCMRKAHPLSSARPTKSKCRLTA